MLNPLLRDIHQKHNHEGVEYVGSVIQQEFWILGVRKALRNIKSQCVLCRKLRAQTKVLFMADLPAEGLDYQSFLYQCWRRLLWSV